VLTAALAITTYEIVRHNVLAERQKSAVRAAYFDAAVVRAGISSDDADIVTALRALDTGQARKPLVRRDGTWYARSADDNLTRAVPTALVSAVTEGHAALQRVKVAGQPMLVVGLPLPSGDAFYEVQSLAEARTTLRTVATALFGVAFAGTALAALLSWSMSRRALLPLALVSGAAEQVSSGDFTTRIPESRDPDLRELTRSFNGMVSQVRTRIEREQRFAADVSHELRSPLQTLAASAALLQKRRDSLDPRAGAAVDLLVAEIDRFSDLVQSLLELAKCDRPAHFTLVEIHDVLERLASRHGLPTELFHIDRNVPTWCTDEQRLERVLDNLIHNAAKHGGGVAAISASYHEGSLLLDVDDTGPGVPWDERAIVFRRFARGRAAHARGASEGTGLGLAIVAEYVESLAGHVAILDRPGGGARFRVQLPKPPVEPS
jgi:signal transduction histidine kinase